MQIDVDLEDWSGSAVVRRRGREYSRKAAVDFLDAPAKLTARQVLFYRNLMRLALASGSSRLPVDFELRDGTEMYLDRGCIKIAEHAGFIQPLENGISGTVDTIVLNWRVE